MVRGNGEEALQLRVSTQVGSVGLQEGPQSAVAHILHDQNVGLCTENIPVRDRDVGPYRGTRLQEECNRRYRLVHSYRLGKGGN